jgi:hypothetical protein
MHKKLFVGVGLIALTGMLGASVASAASQTHSVAPRTSHLQLAKDEAAAAPAGESAQKKSHKKKHKKAKKHHQPKGSAPAAEPATK